MVRCLFGGPNATAIGALGAAFLTRRKPDTASSRKPNISHGIHPHFLPRLNARAKSAAIDSDGDASAGNFGEAGTLRASGVSETRGISNA
jgi:hypothetical protein